MKRKHETEELLASKQFSTLLLVLVAQRLYREACALGWENQCHFIVTDKGVHQEQLLKVEFESNVGFHPEFYRHLAEKFVRELTPYFPEYKQHI